MVFKDSCNTCLILRLTSENLCCSFVRVWLLASCPVKKKKDFQKSYLCKETENRCKVSLLFARNKRARCPRNWTSAPRSQKDGAQRHQQESARTTPGSRWSFFYKISLFSCLWIKTRRGTFTAWLTFNQVIKRSISLDEIISLSSGFDLYVFSPFFSHSTESN